MSDLRVFRIEGQKVKSVEAKTMTLEKSLQTLIESNLDEMLGIRFVATEHSDVVRVLPLLTRSFENS